MQIYIYEGPVTIFDRVVAIKWCAKTRAASEKKARSNLVYQFKKQNGLVASAGSVKLPGKIISGGCA